MSESSTDVGRVSATVVISQPVRPEREQEYLRWQEEINDVCRTFPGFEAVQVVPPVPGIQDTYVVMFRFDSFEHLDNWLQCDARKALLARAEQLFIREPRPHVVAGGPGPSARAGMVVSTRVKPGREAAYRQWQAAIDAETAKFPGFLGAELFPPIPGVHAEWVTVVRFDSADRLRSWLTSDARRRLLAEAVPLWEESRVESIGGGFPGWFTPGVTASGAPERPPIWKEAMIVLLALYPTVMLLTYFLSPWLSGLSPAVGMFVGNVVSVAILTWLLMAPLNRLFRFWLPPAPARTWRGEALGAALVLVGYAVSLLVFVSIE